MFHALLQCMTRSGKRGTKALGRSRDNWRECYKYTSGIYRVPVGLLERDAESKTRGHSKKWKKPRVESTCRRTFFSQRIVNAWMELTPCQKHWVVSAPTLNSFKSRLDTLWKSHTYEESEEWYSNTRPCKSKKKHGSPPLPPPWLCKMKGTKLKKTCLATKATTGTIKGVLA